ncbi:hypothetical protein RFI_12474 [Reticulomyxa filosa]|uniref:Uncharacterized protein n=1 Tax=Reticulomyxa filosa TaxID=46433 RepID=X6NFK8_RETFI|nr:hypothetical protein RFI_12474 [Reticulomyxa filosa]|eukprot:ETO24683.1 hypothetical protein RFI_12474 [Reticulomyxa filosa]
MTVSMPLKYAERFSMIREAVLENYLLKGNEPERVLDTKNAKSNQDNQSAGPASNPFMSSDSEKAKKFAIGNDDDDDANNTTLVYKIQMSANITSSETMQLLVDVLDGKVLQLTAQQLNNLDKCLFYFYPIIL